jgi:hypothetical protein
VRTRAVSSQSRRTLGSSLAGAVLLGAGAAAFGCMAEEDPAVAESAACLADVGELYERRIEPLLAADRPKSCNQCHLSGVDLGLFVRDSMCGTRACLFERGLVDREQPEESLILQWIARADPQSELVTEAVIAEEYEGFSEFVQALTQCGGESCAGVTCAGSGAPEPCSDGEPSVLGSRLVPEGAGCDSVSIEQVFQDTAYAERGRCFPCHFTTEPLAALDAPRWLEARGGCDAGAATTLRNVIDGGYFDLNEPGNSAILVKPLAREFGGGPHGGGEKFHDKNDAEYRTWLGFIEYYAACQQ